jgi:hypothetical protein
VSEYVLDNAVTMAWCFSDEATAYTENLLDRPSNLADSAVVPAPVVAFSVYTESTSDTPLVFEPPYSAPLSNTQMIQCRTHF